MVFSTATRFWRQTVMEEATLKNTETMAALLPTILSDDEDDNRINVKKQSDKKKAKKSKVAKEKVDSEDDASAASSGDEMDGDFEFGGLLVRIRYLMFIVFINNFLCSNDI